MDVFVTGGTGALGQPVVQRLVAAGHRVRGLARTERAAETLRRLGAEPVRVDLFDAAGLRAAVAGADAVLHLATCIPPPTGMRKRGAWEENDRIRREGTRNLVDAGLAAGVRTFIYPSVVLAYPDRGDAWIDASSTAPHPVSDVVQSTLEAEAEVARFTAQGRRGVVLRMGQFYGPDPLSRELVKAARRGISGLPGGDEAYLSFIWIEDAAEAVIAALDDQAPAGTYDVVDDEPIRRRDARAALAHAVGRSRLWRIPGLVQRLLAGRQTRLVSLSLRVSNRRFREVSGWSPSVPNARVGWLRLATELAGTAEGGGAGATRATRRAGRWLTVLALAIAPVAALALLRIAGQLPVPAERQQRGAGYAYQPRAAPALK